MFWCYGVVVDGVGVVFNNIEYGLGCGGIGAKQYQVVVVNINVVLKNVEVVLNNIVYVFDFRNVWG